MDKLCCIVNGNFNCADCKRSLCQKHVTMHRSGMLHKVQRCLQCHRKFVQPHRTGDTRIPALGIWYAQVSRRQRKQNKIVVYKPSVWFSR